MGVGIPLRPNPRHNDYPLHEHHDRRSDDRQRRSAGDDFQDWLRLHHSLGRKVGAVGLPAFGTVRIGGSARRGVADDRRRHRKGDGVIDPQRAPVLEGNLAALQRTKLSQCLSRLWAAGGNVTGITSLNTEVVSKRLELLHEVVPKASTIGLLVNQADPQLAHVNIAGIQAASRNLGLQIVVLNASSNDEIDEVFAALARQGIGALVVTADSHFNARSQQLAALVLRYALPAISPIREFTVAGGLFSYGTSLVGIYRQVGSYTAKILKGEKAAELPVSQSTKVELVINLRTAKLLGLSFPLAVLGRADEVIE